jgi:hypothetical protein
MPMARTGFWVFVSNPRRFPIDRLMRERLPKDAKYSWTVRKSDVFEPGDFGLVRTVVPARENKRTEAQLKEDGASEQLASGIYAVCEVLSKNRPWAAKMNEDLCPAPGGAHREHRPVHQSMTSLTAIPRLQEFRIAR